MTELHLIVETPNGCGMMDRATYDALPGPVRATVEILAVCPSKAKACFIYDRLPQDWSDVALAWGKDSAEAVEVVGVLRADEGGGQ